MEQDQNNFTLDFKDGTIQVHRHTMGTQVIFRIIFSNKRTPLVVTGATHSNAYKFWTSIPEGRQKEAEEAGELISEYFKSFK